MNNTLFNKSLDFFPDRVQGKRIGRIKLQRMLFETEKYAKEFAF